MKLTIGADPELFVKKDGRYVSAHGLVPGTKMEPHFVDGGAIQVDGMALEFNIFPASSNKEFVHNIDTVMATLRKMVPSEYEFAIDPVARFGRRYIAKQPPVARMLGCEPDFNAYTGVENAPPNAKAPIRTAAGHIHIGWQEPYEENMTTQHFDFCCSFVKQLDFVLGIPSLLLDPDNTRRSLYGQAGAFRPKPYGVEYRVLSNFWLKSKALKQWVFSSTKRAYNMLTKEDINLNDRYGDLAYRVINDRKYFNNPVINSFLYDIPQIRMPVSG